MRRFSTGRGSPRSSFTYMPGSSCRRSGPQALAELFGVPLSSGTVAALTARAAGRLDGFLEEIRTRIAGAGFAGFDETGLRAGESCAGCIAPGPASTPCCRATPGGARRRWTPWVSCQASPGSPFTTPGCRMTPTRPPATSFAALTWQGNGRPSPARPPPGSGAGPPRPRKHLPRCSAWQRTRSRSAATPSTRPRWPPGPEPAAPPP